ncbi:MAG: hypothetical protein H6742_16895 [Alphaproteobacteria bacterium]|nr:hypothetical protein [Alphaproteobacteria bacterium]
MTDSNDAPQADLPPLDDCGFVQVPAPGDAGSDPLWMTCNRCGKSDHFWLADGIVRCRCGARYDHAVRPDGDTVPVAQLRFVPFKQGPMQLADVEWDPVRIVMIVGAIAALGGGLAWVWLR